MDRIIVVLVIGTVGGMLAKYAKNARWLIAWRSVRRGHLQSFGRRP